MEAVLLAFEIDLCSVVAFMIGLAGPNRFSERHNQGKCPVRANLDGGRHSRNTSRPSPAVGRADGGLWLSGCPGRLLV